MARLTISRRRWPVGVARAALAALVAACGGGDGSGSGGAGGADPSGLAEGGVPAADLPYAPCPAGDAVGQFVIALGDGFTSVAGKVSDGVAPGPDPEELDRAGECRLLRKAQTTCTPECPVATEACNSEGMCAPLPRTHDVGTVTVHGLVIPMRMSANAVTHGYSNPAQPPLPDPGFAPGADLRITTGGGDYAPFALRGWGISRLVLGSDPIEVAQGQPTRLGWQVLEVPGPTRVEVDLNINFHGTTNTSIKCDFADSGAGEIPARLIDGLIALGFSGFPTLSATRRSVTSRPIEPGCVELVVSSEVSTSVRLEGVASCNRDTPCPAGQTCLPVVLFCQ